MALNQKDLQSIKSIVQDSETRMKDIVQGSIQESEARMKEFIRSEFRINNMVIDTQFREVHAKLDLLEKQTTKNFQRVESYLQLHHTRIEKFEQ
ncbi:hypothetical protein KBD81_05430 [Candidatus Woesebacteria bacterium]|nr:hypothetical protein [Candidatus Woesebacteria bacterium]